MIAKDLKTLGSREIRARLRQELPEKAFHRAPARALWFLPHLALVATGTAAVVGFSLSWPVNLAIAVVVGHSYACMAFLAHEVLHGAQVRSRRLQNVLGYVGFGPLLISPLLWRVWHNQVHHGHTNRGDRDPDSFGTIGRYRRIRSTRFVARLAPGSGSWLSYLFFFYWFSFHAQIVLWIQSRALPAFRRFPRRRAILESAAFLSAWIALAILAGPIGAIFVVLLPLAVANFLIMSYVATNHFLRPQSDHDDPLASSMSVTTHPILDGLHGNFSHHVEHHLFPTMNGRYFSLVRKWLRHNVGACYVSPAHWKACFALYRTPRIYLDANTLCDPEKAESAMEIGDITNWLQS